MIPDSKGRAAADAAHGGHAQDVQETQQASLPLALGPRQHSLLGEPARTLDELPTGPGDGKSPAAATDLLGCA